MRGDLIAFVEANTRLAATPLVPEIMLRLACDATGIFAAAAVEPAERFAPYWAFAWPGGQATARYLLDHPESVRGRRVLDIGAGSGLAAIAAMQAGAAHALAADIDPMAAIAIDLNARANGVAVETLTADILGAMPPADLVLMGDLVYEPEMAIRVAALLETIARGGADVLVADRTSARRLVPVKAGAPSKCSLAPPRPPKPGHRGRNQNRPPVAFELIAEYDAPLMPRLPAHPFEKARLWRLSTKSSG